MIRTAVCNFDNTNFRSPSRWFWLNYARRAFDACRWIIQEYVGGRALRDPDPDPAGFTNPESQSKVKISNLGIWDHESIPGSSLIWHKKNIT
jgi:hypothetical protein